MFSSARLSRSFVAFTIFHASSISDFKPAIVAWSSSLSLNAVCTFAALVTISELSARHFVTRRRSLSCELTSAAWSFSYSARNLSRDGVARDLRQHLRGRGGRAGGARNA
jgi:hypothetical protein